MPQPGCVCPHCEGARRDPTLRRRVACIAVEGATGCTFLVDATPDIRDQVDALRAAGAGRSKFVDTIALSHAHIGHYLGLAFLGKEAMHSKGLPAERFRYGNPSW